jgi:arginase
MSDRVIEIISSETENGAGKRGASLGPQALFLEARQMGFDRMLSYPHSYAESYNDKYDVEDKTPNSHNVDTVLDGLNSLSRNVTDALNRGVFPVVFSGDHSNGAGGISGLKEAVDGEIGVIWVDAHADLHSPYTSPSGNMHGMPLGASLGLDHLPTVTPRNSLSERELNGWNGYKTLGDKGIVPKISAENLVFIGIRDLEGEEWDIINSLGIKYYTPEMIGEMGMQSVLDECFKYLSHVEHIYLSFDVDSLDSSISMGTGTPVPNGLTIEDGQKVFQRCFNDEKVKVFEITEINPMLDVENKMAKSIIECLKEVM